MLLRQVRSRQPTQLVGVDNSHPLAKQLLLAWVGPIDANQAKGGLATKIGPPVFGRNVTGGVAKTLTTSQGLRWATPLATSTGFDITFAAIVKPADITQTDKRIVGISPATSDSGLALWYNSGALGYVKMGQASGTSGLSLTAGEEYFVAFSYDHDATVTTYRYLTKNLRTGVIQTAAPTTGLTNWNTTGTTYDVFIGTQNTTPSSNGFIGDVSFAAAWTRPLTEIELRNLASNPYQFFTPTVRFFAVPSQTNGGSLTATLGDATLSATAGLQIKGTASATLDATVAATSKLLIAGVLSSSLEAASLSATGSAPAAGSGVLAATLADASLSATGAVQIQGVASKTLDAATSTATGAVQIKGSFAGTTDASLSATGAVQIKGSLSQTLSATLTATGVQLSTGTLSKTLADATLSATGERRPIGAVDVTLADATSTATGALQIKGTTASLLADASLTASMVHVTLGAADITLDGVSSEATGQVLLQGSASVALDACTIFASATSIKVTLGEVAVTLDSATSTGEGHSMRLAKRLSQITSSSRTRVVSGSRANVKTRTR